MEEILTVMQVAYLLKTQRRNVKWMINTNKLEAVFSRKKYLIKKSSFEKMLHEKLEKYSRLREFINEKDKIQYWNNCNFEVTSRSDNDEYVTVCQAAYLLKKSRQSIYEMLKSGRLERYKVKDCNKRYITIKSLERVLSGIDEYYERATSYIQCSDVYDYWLRSNIETETYEQERRRRRKDG